MAGQVHVMFDVIARHGVRKVRQIARARGDHGDALGDIARMLRLGWAISVAGLSNAALGWDWDATQGTPCGIIDRLNKEIKMRAQAIQGEGAACGAGSHG